MTNFLNGPEYVSSLPTILLLSSFDGSDQLSPSLISSLLQFFSLSYRNDKDTFYLLNNYRLLVLPHSNVEGAFNIRKEEKTETGEKVDPWFDFNYGVMDSEHKCFQTSTARLIAHLFKEYLIIGTLILSKGKDAILFPFGSKIKHEKQKSHDHKAFVSISESLSKFSPDDLSLNIHKMQTNLLSEESQGQGRFEDWSYASSEDIENVDINCFDVSSYLNSSSGLQKGSEISGNKDLLILEKSQKEKSGLKQKDFLRQFLVLTSSAMVLNSINPVKDLNKMSLKLLIPGQFSNRSFVFKLKVGGENEIELYPSQDKTHSKPFLRKRAYTTRVLGLLRTFSYFVKKRLDIYSMHLSKNKKSLLLKLKVRGCLQINDFQLASKGLSLSFSKEDVINSGDYFLASLTLKPTQSQTLEDFEGNFQISVLCDYTINDDQKPFSNLIRSKIDPNYRVLEANSVWGSTRVSQLNVNNFSIPLMLQHKQTSDNLEDLFFRQRDDLVSLVVPQKFFAYVKDGFYLLFEYDLQARRIIYRIQNLDESISAKNIRFQDFNWEVKFFYENFDHSTAQHEEDFSINQEFFTGSPRSLEGFFSLLGKSLHVISQDQDSFFSTKSLIRVFDKDSSFGKHSGLPIPPEGINCFSNDFTHSSEVFYLSIQASSAQSDLHQIHFYTLEKRIFRVRLEFFDQIIPLYQDQTFNGYDLPTLKGFSKFIGIIEKNDFNLLGQQISIMFHHNSLYQKCHLGRRNPFYKAKDVLLLWSQKHSFYQGISNQGQGFKWEVLLMVIIFALFAVFIVLGCKFGKKIKQKWLGEKQVQKVEAI